MQTRRRSLAPRTLPAVILAASAAVSAGRAVAAAPSAVLELPDGGMLPGSLERSAAGGGTITWRSPVFARPLEFHIDEIVSARFTGGEPSGPASPFRIVLRGGDTLEGSVASIDATAVAVVPRGGEEPVRLPRALVESIARTGGRGTGGFVGPGGLAGWRCVPENAWRSAAGHIAAVRPGRADRDVAAPARAVYDAVVSWRRRPDIRLIPAAADDPADDGYWVELLRLPDGTAEAAVVRRERNAAAVQPLAAGDASTKSLRILLFVDQRRGRLAARTVDRGVAGPVAEVVVPPSAAEPSGAFRIVVGAGDASLESLRVGPWDGEEPAVEVRTTARVTLRDGGELEGDVVAWDAGSDELLVRTADGDVRLALAEVDGVALPAAGDGTGSATPAATVRAALAGGGSLTGAVAGIDDAAVRLTLAGVDGQVSIPRGDIVSLTSLVARPVPRDLPGRVGTLLVGEASLRGCLVDGGEIDAALAWLPQGAVSASPLAAGSGGVDAVVEYVPRPERQSADEAQVEIGGIGGMVNQDPQGFFVVTMLSEDGAAAQDGRLQPGDRLLEIRPRPEGDFVATRGHDVTTVMNLLRGRVGSAVVLRVATPGGEPREIELRRGMIYVAGRDVLQQALATHARLATARGVRPEDAAAYPSLAILRSGDVVPCMVVGMDAGTVTLRTPVVHGDGDRPVVVAERLVQAVELDPLAPPRGIERPRFERLLMLPRSQRESPPTHMVRLGDGDYLRGRLVSLDERTLVLEVRGAVKRLPRETVARVIWLHPPAPSGQGDRREGEPPAGLLVQGVGRGRRVTLLPEGVADGVLRGTSPALGPGQIDLREVERLLVGSAIDGEAEELPYRQWILRPAPEPKALRSADPPR